MSLLEERIKRASKTRPQGIPVATVKPTQCSPIKRNPQYEQSPPQLNNDTYTCGAGSEDESLPNDEDVYEDVEPAPQPVAVSPQTESQQR